MRQPFFLLCLTLPMVLAPGAAHCAPQSHEAYEPPAAASVDLGPNLLLHAPVKASPHWATCAPEYAVDGKRDGPSPHWAAENIPVWLTVELAEPRDLNLIRLWTFWDNRRYYQYVVEGSLDGLNWSVLGDRRENTTPQSESGETVSFPTTKLKFVRTTFTKNSAGNSTGGHIVEIEGYCLDARTAEAFAAYEKAWGGASGLRGAFGSLDERYARDEPPTLPATAGSAWSGAAWRGERVQAQLVLWTAAGARQVRVRTADLKSDKGDVLGAAALRARFVRYVLADGKLVGDVLDDETRLDLPAHSTRPVWVSVDVPADARPGVYSGRVEVLTQGQPALPFDLKLEVLPLTLPPPAQWKFRLDLWQNPYAVARYHHVQPWSEEHLKLLEPHLRLLAEAGQKCVTTSIIHRPWGTQTYDPYDSMVEWTRKADGAFAYDYSHFDQYVELAMRCGITDSISCYTVASPRYLDEATGEYTSGGYSLQDLWRPFLKDFTAHLAAKGWLAKTALAMGEWPIAQMKPMLEFLRQDAPGLKIALAGSNEPELADKIDDWCVFITPPLDPAIARQRAAKGLTTTTYVCCGPGRPNTFTASPPAEAVWLGWYCAAQGYSGLLRWAYDSWTQDPLQDTSHVTWTAGDCFLVYPGARSSIRFERLREGIADFEKLRIVREALLIRSDGAAHDALLKLDAALQGFDFTKAQTSPAAGPVNAAKQALEAAAREAGK